MDVTAAFILYLLLYRLAVVAAGVVAIVLGARLLRSGLEAQQETELGVSLPGYRVTLRRLAPGTCFALFGASLIVAMVVTGGPEMTWTLVRGEVAQLDSGQSAAPAPEPVSTRAELRLRGADAESLRRLTARGVELERRGDRAGAADAYRRAVDAMAAPMNHLAWLYQEDGQLDLAAPLAEMAVRLAPQEASYLDTLAEVRWQQGDRRGALELLERAAALEPERFADKLASLRGEP